MRLYIIRHGETDWNIVRRMQGRTDIPLNENGIALAEETGKHMKDIPLDLVITSPLIRARKTAECIVGERNIPIFVEERICEMSFGEWEGKEILDETQVPPAFRDMFYKDPFHCEPAPGGESFQEVCDRTGEFLKELRENQEFANKNILISTHGGAGRCLLSHFFQDGDLWRGCIPPNCSVCIVDVTKKDRRVIEIDRCYWK